MEIAPPSDRGYGWGVDHSNRLRDAVNRRAEQRGGEPTRAGMHPLVIQMAAQQGVDISKVDAAEGDRLLAEAERRAHQERLARQATILLSRLPEAYREATIPRTDFGAKAMAWLRDYRRGSRRSLVILGPTGTGKTWTACAIARALLLEDTIPVVVVTVKDFLESLRPSGDSTAQWDMVGYVTTPVLVLDDLGAENLTPWAHEQLYRLAHERSHNNRPMIITSNLLPGSVYGDGSATIRGQYDQRTVERLFGGASLITLSGDTLRPMPF